MEEIMTLAEIHSRFDSEWVLVEDPELDEQGEVIRGTVVFHSKDPDEVDRVDMQRHAESAAYVYTGQMPENTAIVL